MPRRIGRHGRSHGRSRRFGSSSSTAVAVPPNDLMNYFFANDNCGKYVTSGYHNANPNYT